MNLNGGDMYEVVVRREDSIDSEHTVGVNIPTEITNYGPGRQREVRGPVQE